MTPAVRVIGLTKRFGPIRALDQVSFDVPPHSIFGLLGPNGAGKTTLFSITANFLKSDAGAVEVLGCDVRRISRLRGRLTILPQDAQFQRNLPILEQLIFFRRLDGCDRADAEKQVLHTLALVGLEAVARRRVGTLSHGMIKRLGIAQAFLGAPEVILLDEPTSGLDPANARQIRDLIKQLQQQATIVVSSHNLAEIQELCDHVAILDRGRLILASSVDDITRAGQESHLSLSRALTEPEVARVRAVPGVRDLVLMNHAAGALAKDSTNYVLILDHTAANADVALAAVLRALLESGITPRRITEGRSLETHFLSVTGRGDE